MSTISNTHTIAQLTKTSVALTGQRLVRLIAKADRSGKYPSANLTESMCVSIPRIAQEDIVEVIDKLLPHIVKMCEEAQDKIVREYRIESGRNEIQDSVISMDAILGYMEDSIAGDRVSKEYLQEWFAGNYGDIAKDWINTISNGSLHVDLVETKYNVIRDMFAGWASPKYSPNIPSLKAMIRLGTYLTDAEANDSRMDSILSRANTMLVKKEAELSVDALGF